MRTVVTGIGVVSPYGVGQETFWHGVASGTQAFRDITRFDASNYRNTLAGEVPDFEPGEEERAAAFAVSAAREAMTHANLAPDTPVGLILGTNFGGMEAAESAFRERLNGTIPQNCTRYLPSHTLNAVRTATGTSGPQAAVSLSCASGAATIGMALQWIRLGRAEVVLAGGFDELSESCYAGLSALRAISQDTIRPWDINRSGTLFAEGAAVLVLESEAHAQQRGATPMAAILGRGLDNDAFHMTAPEKTGSGIARAMRMALTDAGRDAREVEHMNCHGTGTKYNDLIETTAIRSVFGEHADDMVFTANKSLFGHAMGAAGALETTATVLSIRDGIIPPTIGCEEPDPEIAIDLCRGQARKQPISLAITNSYGLGGTNASLIVGTA